jgi:hypothetical protein
VTRNGVFLRYPTTQPKLWVRTPFMARCTRYNIMWYKLSVVSTGYSGLLHQYNWSPQYNWNIVASNTINQIHDTIYQYMENKLQILNLIRLGKNEIKNLNNLTILKRTLLAWSLGGHIHQYRPLSKMTTVTNNRTFFKVIWKENIMEFLD